MQYNILFFCFLSFKHKDAVIFPWILKMPSIFLDVFNNFVFKMYLFLKFCYKKNSAIAYFNNFKNLKHILRIIIIYTTFSISFFCFIFKNKDSFVHFSWILRKSSLFLGVFTSRCKKAYIIVCTIFFSKNSYQAYKVAKKNLFQKFRSKFYNPNIFL